MFAPLKKVRLGPGGQTKSGMVDWRDHQYQLVAPGRGKKQESRHGLLAVTSTLVLLFVVALVTTDHGDKTSVLDDIAITPGTDGQGTGTLKKFLPDEDQLGDLGGTSDYGISNDYQQDAADQEVHDFVIDNTNPITGELNASVPTRDMIAVQNGVEVDRDFNFSDLQNLPPSPKDAIINEAADDPFMRVAEGGDAKGY